MIAIVTVVLALAALAAGLRAAWLWHVASVDPPPPDYAGELTILGQGFRHGDALDAAANNRKAAWWTGMVAFLSAITTVWATVAPIVEKYLMPQ